MTFCGLKQAQQLFLLCGGKSKDKISKKFEKNLNSTQYKYFELDDYQQTLANLDKFNDTLLNEDITITKNKLLNMSKNITLMDILSNSTNKQDVELYKLLNACSLTKCANIPMMCVKSFKPTPKQTPLSVKSSPKVANGIKIFSNSVKTKQTIEIHRGMTINALFCRDDWLYVKTAQNECGYVPLDTCRPVGRKITQDQDKTVLNNKTCVSLLDVTNDQCTQNDDYVQIENLSELEFTSDINDSSKDMRLYKIKHYLRSLDCVNDDVQIGSSSNSNASSMAGGLDSGFSDTDCSTNLLITKSQSCDMLPTTKRQSLLPPIQRRGGIKTNGSICSTPTPVVHVQQSMQHVIEQSHKNLSTIIEQSSLSDTISKLHINDTCEMMRNHCDVLSHKTSLVKLDHELHSSQLKLASSSLSIINDSTATASTNSFVRVVCADYQAQFVDDLQVHIGEHVTLLDDDNNDWCYVISKNGKGYVPRSCLE